MRFRGFNISIATYLTATTYILSSEEMTTFGDLLVFDRLTCYYDLIQGCEISHHIW